MIWLETMLAVFTAAATVAMATFSWQTHSLAKKVQEEAERRADRRAHACRVQAAYRILMAEGIFREALTDARGVLMIANQDNGFTVDRVEVLEAFPGAVAADAVFRALLIIDATFAQVRSLATTLGMYAKPAFWFTPLPLHKGFLSQVQGFAKTALPLIEEAQRKAGLLSAAEREAWARENLPGDGLFKTGSASGDTDGANDEAGKA